MENGTLQTHYHECYKVHHACAIAAVEYLVIHEQGYIKQIELLNRTIELLEKQLDYSNPLR